MESIALNVIGQNWSGEKVSFFLEDLELARVALSCHTALDVLCLKMHEARLLGCRCQRGPLSQQEKPFSHRGRAVTKKERDVVRENEGKETV